MRDYQAVDRVTGQQDFDLPQPSSAQLSQKRLPLIKERHLPSERELADILRQMGKKKPEDELNCGSCGYLPRKGHCRLSGQGGNLHVPAVSERAGRELYRKYRQ